MTFTVVYDANVLYPNTLRDLLIRIAQSGTVQAKWTNAILDEMSRALRRNRPDIPEEKLERLRELMNTRPFATAWWPATSRSSRA
jgi:hypothetical protein